MSHHFATLELVNYARGVVDADQGDDLIAHCRACKECGNRLAAVLALRRAVQAQHARSVRRRWLAAAAAIATIGLGAFALQVRGSFVDRDPSSSIAREPVATGIAALATTEPLPDVIVQIHVGGAILADSANLQPRLLAAGEMIARGEYSGAVAALEQLRAADPTSRVIAGYLGIARYLSGDNSEAVGLLLAIGKSERNESVASFAQWYLANYFLRRDQLDLAVANLSELAPLSERPGRMAKQLLSDLEPYLR